MSNELITDVVIRDYRSSDATAIVKLFYETVHLVNRRDYSPEQIEAWAPEIPDPEKWDHRMRERCTLVAEKKGELLAFAELEYDGHLDMFFCRSDIVGHGVGRRLYRTIEERAVKFGLTRLFLEGSITAKPFFSRCGFRVLQQQFFVRRDVPMTNFRMEKQLVTSPR